MSDFPDLPPFPDDVPTVPLLVIDYQLIKDGDQGETDKLWEAATKLGFWYLKNHGLDDEAERMFQMGAETMALPLEEKLRFEQGDTGKSFGYKAQGANAVDESGQRDSVEFINVAADDARAFPGVAHRTYPRPVHARMADTVVPWTRGAAAVNAAVLAVFDARLGLAPGTLAARHDPAQHSGSESRVIRKPPTPEMRPEQAALGAHTDFGSLSFLVNRLGGLQVYPPGADGWCYVKPLPGHAICNIGDALALFSGGILRSNLHRVVAPPGAQAAYTRWSLVFFTRPADGVPLRALAEHSSKIAAAVAAAPDPARWASRETAGEWYARRTRNQRVNNRTGPETWRASRGTEHVDDTVGAGVVGVAA
ncbi:clavaminate synthase-like protein [Phanerochaete sordida]|uniref:Clavaminate synthase-like protein n=1 Tax=Phanerochaete sordida TaxID=48140 RepID=A0A9P3LKI1_9APHY|nr:clavaminate synthase-like protein [Phanerochaete sordida]